LVSIQVVVPALLRVDSSELTTEMAITPPIIPSDQLIGNLPPKASFSQTIFKPTNTRTSARPYFNKAKRSTAPASRK
jgi:hypothetical protein